jgi:hypothetical protein
VTFRKQVKIPPDSDLQHLGLPLLPQIFYLLVKGDADIVVVLRNARYIDGNGRMRDPTRKVRGKEIKHTNGIRTEPLVTL